MEFIDVSLNSMPNLSLAFQKHLPAASWNENLNAPGHQTIIPLLILKPTSWPPHPLLQSRLCLHVSLAVQEPAPHQAVARWGYKHSIKPCQPTRDRAVKCPRGCRWAGPLTQLRKQSRRNGTWKCDFPLLRKRSDKSSAASHHGLIAVKPFDVPSLNQS